MAKKSKVVKVLGGYGRSGRVLRMTLPSRIANLMEVRRGDKILWESTGPGCATVTLVEHGTVRSQKPAPSRRRKSADEQMVDELLACMATKEDLL